MQAPWILWRTVLVEVLMHTALGLAVIGLLLLVQNLLRFLGQLVAAGLDAADVLRLLVLLLPSYFPYAIPTALLFGILLTFGRMSADGEVVALRASGIGIAQLLPPVLAVGLLATALLCALTFELEPRARLTLKHFVRELGTSTRLATPGRFRSLGQRTLYVQAIGDESCPLEGVFLADFAQGPEPIYIAARCGALHSEADESKIALELVDGSVHLPEDSPDAYRRITFTRMETRLDLTTWVRPGARSRNLTLLELFQATAAFRRGEGPELRGQEGARDVRIEIHRRLAFSLSCILLAILAVPLGVRPVRVGRSWGALMALVVIGGYWLVLSGGEVAAEEGIVAPWVGLWAGDVGVLLLALVLVRRLRRVEV